MLRQDGVPELQIVQEDGALRVDPRVALDGVADIGLVVSDEVEAQLTGQLGPLGKCLYPGSGIYQTWIGWAA